MFFGRDTLKSVSACYIAATLAWACIKNDDRAEVLFLAQMIIKK